MDVGGATCNVTWTRIAERGDVDSFFEVSCEGAMARYWQRKAGGDDIGWGITIHRFEMRAAKGLPKLLVYDVDNDYGEHQNNQAIPTNQLSGVFDPVLGEASSSADELIGLIESEVTKMDSLDL